MRLSIWTGLIQTGIRDKPDLEGVNKMKNKNKYLIGDVSKICNIPKKTLRYYDEIDVIKPETISEFNGYRYYSMDNMQDIIILKYFKQMGYSLSEIRNNFNSHSFNYILESLNFKNNELEEEKKRLENKITATADWKLLILEAKSVLGGVSKQVLEKEVQEDLYPCLRQSFRYDYKATIINIPWVKTLEINNEEITGPVMLYFSSLEEKKAGCSETTTIFQKGLRNEENNMEKLKFGGKFLSTYHIGAHETIHKAYERIIAYAKKRGYRLRKECIERFVVDYWTTKENSLFVTEVLVPIEK